ncbi:helix-turn-helix transcriptional regulator [Lentzea tibetensis]|uniref:Helix-turn-helix transcriptional regulator n=1 Tax=Lentzea tibetensis TaxID=2591470 RepID=A0A563EUP9_9PSEU|nr:helix-turn-helix transcriptional regulator [Lentzea tibetensis]TWP51221.1 helix-turn-helix transcriptional regulator [Lentzea tibetensis]
MNPLYRELVVDGPIPVDVPDPAALAELDAAGLTTRSPCHPGMVVPVLPEVACAELLAAFAEGLAARHARLRAALAEVVAPQPDDGGLVEVLTDPNAIKRAATEVLAHARRDACEFAVATHSEGLTEVVPHEAEVLPGVRYRVVYAASCLGDPIGRQLIGLSRAAGEEQRFFPGWMTSLRIGDDVALVRLSSGALHVRSRSLVGLLRAWFDLVWERSSPSDDDENPLTPAEQAVLELQAAGHKDTAIARALGIHVRTVRRHVASVLAHLGADSRFAAGVEAARRGWLRQ